VEVTSTDDDILVQHEEKLTSDETFPHKDGERYTQHLHVSTKEVGETIHKTTQSETEINPSCVLHVNQEQPLFDNDVTAGTCHAVIQRQPNSEDNKIYMYKSIAQRVEDRT